MAIGIVRPVNRQQRFSSARAQPRAFGAGLATAVSGLASAVGELGTSQEQVEEAVLDQQRAREDFNVESAFIDATTEMAKRQDARKAEAPVDGAGLTDQTELEVEQDSEAFLAANIPEHRTDLREKYGLALQRSKQSQVLDSFAFEDNAFNTNATRIIEETVNQFQGDVYSGRRTYEDAQADTEELISKLTLDETVKQQLREDASTFFRASQFQHETRAALENDAYMSTLGLQETNMLHTIAGPESNGRWNVRYDGSDTGTTFTDMSKHPAVYEKITSGKHKGEYSSAAGAYQITHTTWKRLLEIPALDLTDFSPESQTRAALYLLEERYNANRKGGRSYDEIMADGTPEEILSIKYVTSGPNLNNPLFEGWQTMKDEDFLAMAMGRSTIEFSGGVAPAPSIWDDERFADISHADKFRLTSSARTDVGNTTNAQNKAKFDAMLDAVNAGGGSREAIAAADFVTAPQRQQLNTRFGIVNEEKEVAQQAASNLLNPAHTFMDNAEGRAQMNALFGEGGTFALKERNEEYVNAALVPMAQRTGLIPTEAMATLDRQFNSADPATSMFALKTMAALEQAAPGSFATDLKQHQQAVSYYQVAGEFVTPEDMHERIKAYTDPTFATARTQLSKAATAEIKDFTPDTFIKNIKISRFGVDSPVVDVSGTASIQIQREGSKLYHANYVFTNGNSEQAMEMTNQQLASVWGPSAIGEPLVDFFGMDLGSATEVGTFGKYVPDNFPALVPPIDGSLDWVEQQVREETGVGDFTRFQLVADAQTPQDIDNGKVPSYLVYFQDEDGNVQAVQGSDIVVTGPDGTEISREPNPRAYRYTPNHLVSSTHLSEKRLIKQRREEAVDFIVNVRPELEKSIRMLEEQGGDPAVIKAMKQELIDNKKEINSLREDPEFDRRMIEAAEDELFELRLQEAE